MLSRPWYPVINPAGGLAYHLRAARYRRLWQPFRSQLAEWLGAWQPSEAHLALVGPSAGYNFPFAFLDRFDVITVFEPDPVACWLFSRAFFRALGPKAPRINFERADHLVEHPDRLLAFLTGQGAAVLFCNVLGQVVHLVPDSDCERRLAEVRRCVHEMIQHRGWASFHDRVSGPLEPSATVFVAEERWSDEELISRAYHSMNGAPTVELADHQTDGYFPRDMPHVYMSWQLERGTYHLIEGVHS